jgi:hypothetical protein
MDEMLMNDGRHLHCTERIAVQVWTIDHKEWTMVYHSWSERESGHHV